MFLCDGCTDNPGIARSHGPCEMCGAVTGCTNAHPSPRKQQTAVPMRMSHDTLRDLRDKVTAACGLVDGVVYSDEARDLLADRDWWFEEACRVREKFDRDGRAMLGLVDELRALRRRCTVTLDDVVRRGVTWPSCLAWLLHHGWVESGNLLVRVQDDRHALAIPEHIPRVCRVAELHGVVESEWDALAQMARIEVER